MMVMGRRLLMHITLQYYVMASYSALCSFLGFLFFVSYVKILREPHKNVSYKQHC